MARMEHPPVSDTPPNFDPRNVATVWGHGASFIVQTWNHDGQCTSTSPWMSQEDATTLCSTINTNLGLRHAN